MIVFIVKAESGQWTEWKSCGDAGIICGIHARDRIVKKEPNMGSELRYLELMCCQEDLERK